MCKFCEEHITLHMDKLQDSFKEGITTNGKRLDVYIHDNGTETVRGPFLYAYVDTGEDDAEIEMQIKFCPLCGKKL